MKSYWFLYLSEHKRWMEMGANIDDGVRFDLKRSLNPLKTPSSTVLIDTTASNVEIHIVQLVNFHTKKWFVLQTMGSNECRMFEIPLPHQKVAAKNLNFVLKEWNKNCVNLRN